jgi:hypothetical protein
MAASLAASIGLVKLDVNLSLQNCTAFFNSFSASYCAAQGYIVSGETDLKIASNWAL